jgi:hypothetical protein
MRTHRSLGSLSSAHGSNQPLAAARMAPMPSPTFVTACDAALTGLRHAVEPDHLHGDAGARLAGAAAGRVVERPHLAHGRARDHQVAHAQGASLGVGGVWQGPRSSPREEVPKRRSRHGSHITRNTGCKHACKQSGLSAHEHPVLRGRTNLHQQRCNGAALAVEVGLDHSARRGLVGARHVALLLGGPGQHLGGAGQERGVDVAGCAGAICPSAEATLSSTQGGFYRRRRSG